jgi:succinate dehydrogenase / fumarate reductase cytochrome b subunit
MRGPRPKYLDLLKIRLPLPGIVSILHRASGALLFLAIPLLLYLLQSSLESPQRYAALGKFFAHPLAKLVLIGLLWAYLHHFCAGIRYLALDLDLGTDLARARASSRAVLAVSIGLTLAIGALLW